MAREIRQIPPTTERLLERRFIFLSSLRTASRKKHVPDGLDLV